MNNYFKLILFAYILITTSCDDENSHDLRISIDGNASEYGYINPDYEGKTEWKEFEVVTLNAKVVESATDGTSFDGWSGDINSEEDEISIMMDSDKELTAHFSRNEYIITVEDAEGGTIRRTPSPYSVNGNQLTYLWGDTILFRADPEDGYRFDAWGHDFIDEMSDSVYRAITEDLHLSATFTDLCALTTGVNDPLGGSVSPNYTEETIDCGTVVDISATVNPGYGFSGWTGNIGDNDIENGLVISVVVDDNKEIIANFSTYSLTIPDVSGGTVLISPDQESYAYGTEITLTANPDLNYSFDGWSGDASGSENPYTFTIESDMTVTASFITYDLTVVVLEGSGEVDITPEQPSYLYNTEITITVEPDSNYIFSSFQVYESQSDSEVITENPYTFNIQSDVYITIIFTEQFTVNIITPDEGVESCSLDPISDGGIYNNGDNVTVECILEDNFQFENWSGDISGSENPYEFTVDSNMEFSPVVTELFDIAICDPLDNGLITINPSQLSYPDGYPDGTEVVITATSDECFSFGNWSSSVLGSLQPGASFTHIVNSSFDICAEFDFLGYNQVDITIEGEGDVSLIPDAGNNFNSYCVGEMVDLTASWDDTGWYFSGWSGDIEDEQVFDNPLSVIITPQIITGDYIDINASFLELCDIEIEYDADAIDSLIFSPEINNEIQYSNSTFTYFCSEVVSITAEINENYSFVDWTGDVPLDSDSLTVELNLVDDLNIALNTLELFTLSFGSGCLDGTVEVNGDSTDTSIEYSYLEGEEITLLATPEEDWTFDGWEISGEDITENPYNITFINEDVLVDCLFEPVLETLVIYTNGDGDVDVMLDSLDSEPINSTFGTTCFAYGCHQTANSCDCYIIPQGTDLYLNASANDDNSVLFMQWTGDLPDGINSNWDSIEFTLDSDSDVTELTANYINYYTLDVSLEGINGSTEEPMCDYNLSPDPIATLGYSEGTEVTIEVECSDSHWSFSNWETDDINLNTQSQSNSITFDITQNIQIIGYCLQEFELSASTNPAEVGEVNFSPPSDSLIYSAGESVMVSVTDTTVQYYFVNWVDTEGDTLSTNSSIDIVMDDDTNITANFSNIYELTLLANGLSASDSLINAFVVYEGDEIVSPDDSGYSFEYGTSVTIEAIPLGQTNFCGWTFPTDFSDDSLSVTFTMDGNRTVMANFCSYWILSTSINDGDSSDDVDGGLIVVNPEISANEDLGPGQYEDNEGVTLTAVSNSDYGYYFTNWTTEADSLDTLSYSETMPIMMDENKDIIANFSNLYKVIVSATPDTLCSATIAYSDGETIPDDDMYEYNSSLILNAESLEPANYGFYAWSYSINGQDTTAIENPLNFQAVEDNNFVATCKELCDLTVDFNISGGTIGVEVLEGNGSSLIQEEINSLSTFTYFCDSEITLTAISDEGYSILYWYDGEAYSNGSSITFNLDGDMSYQAIFSELFELTLDVEEEGTGSISHDSIFPLTSIFAGESIELTANPATGYEFTEWNGDLDGSNNPESISMDDDKAVTAVFNLIPYYLNLSTTEGGAITVLSEVEGELTDNPDSTIYEYGDELNLITSIDAGFYFDGLWSVNGDNYSADTLSIVMDQNYDIEVGFDRVYSLTINEPSNGNITINTPPDVESYYYANSTVSLSTTEDDWYIFSHWSGDVDSSIAYTPDIDILMDSDKTIGAEFEILSFMITLDINGGGSVAVTGADEIPDGVAGNSYQYEADALSHVTLEAYPNADQSFTRWMVNGEASLSNPYIIESLGADYNIIAIFSEE